MQARKQNKKKEIGRILGWSAGAAVSAALLSVRFVSAETIWERFGELSISETSDNVFLSINILSDFFRYALLFFLLVLPQHLL